MLLTSPIPIESGGDRALDSAFVILDARVDNLSQLLADLSSQDVLVLDPAIDGIEQVTAALDARPSTSSLHIVSHGAVGSLQLGSTQLSLSNLDDYVEQLQKWAKVLNGQDILLYGCQVAKGAMGHLFLQQLHQLTGANLAASGQRVGQTGVSQNWILETQIGAVKAQTIFSSELQQSYPAHFANVDFSATPDTLIESEGTLYTFNFKVDEAIPPGESVIVRIEGDTPQAANNELNLINLEFGGLAGGLNTGIIDVSPGLDFSAFDIVITEPNAFISVPVANDFLAEGPESVTWTVTPVSPDTTVSNGTATVNIFDDPSQVPPPPPPPPPAVPEISLTSDITTLVEDEGTQITFTISLSEPPPQGGLPLEITTGIPFGLGDFEFLSADLNGANPIPGAPADNSGLRLAITQQTATITVPIFNDEDRTENGAVTDPDGPLRNDDIGEEQTTFSLVPGDGYTINPDASSVTLTLRDTNAPANTPPDATNDSYSTDFDTALTVDPTSGVLSNDTDGDGDALTAAITTEPTSGTVALNADGSFTYTPSAGFTGEDSFTYTVSDGNEGTDTATVSVKVGDPPPPPPPEPIVVGVSAAPTTLVEEDKTVTTVTFSLSEAPPEDGLNVVVDSDVQASLAEFDVGSAVFTGATLVGPNEDASGFTVNITETTATIDLPVFDDDVDEGVEEITYALQSSDSYTIDDAASSVTLSIEDDDVVDPPVDDGPVVSISTTPEIVSEADGTALVLNFSVDGEIPDDGIDISLTGSAPGILQEFTAAQVRFNEDLEQIFFFDKSVVDSVVGGELDSKAFDIDPDSLGFLSDFDFTITDANASITFQVLDDIIEEADETFTYTIAAGDDYVVDPVAGSSSFTVTDGVAGGVGPTVSFTAAPVELFESEQTRIELAFKVEGDLPPDGVVVELASETPRAIAEFDVTASNPRDPEDKLTVDGPIVTGGNIVGSNETASSLLFRITEPTATLSVEVFEDDDAEGLETFDYKLLNGEGYEVSPTDNAVTITIDDEPGQAPETATVESGVTSVFLDFPLLEEVAGLTLVGADSEAEPFSDDFLVGFAITDETDFTYAIDPFAPVSGTIEHSGTITLGLGGAEATIGEFSIGFDPSRVTDTASGFFVADTLDDPLGLEILFDIGNPGTVASAADSLVISDADLLLSPELAAALGLADLAGADVGDARIDTPEGDVPPPPPPPPTPGEAVTVGFEDLAAGTVITDQFEGLTIAATGGAGSAMIFDSANPTGDDDDLAVPEAGNLLIISEDGDSSNPDDNAGGGVLSFEFDAPVTVDTVDFVDIEETGSAVQLFDADGELIETVDIPPSGDGSFQELAIGVSGVARMDVVLAGSGAVGEVQYTTGEPSGEIEFDIVGTEGDDVLTAEATGSNIDGLGGDDILDGDAANDILVGNAGSDVAQGGEGNDIAFGGDGEDILDGQAGNDVVSGDAGDDVVTGGPGDDILMGVTGNDVLTGNTVSGTDSGSDLFVYGNGDGTDTIVDFEVGIDQIGLVEGELVFADLSLTQDGSNTLLGVSSSGEVLAVLNGVQASALTEDSFRIVPDVSDPSEALAFV